MAEKERRADKAGSLLQTKSDVVCLHKPGIIFKPSPATGQQCLLVQRVFVFVLSPHAAVPSNKKTQMKTQS